MTTTKYICEIAGMKGGCRILFKDNIVAVDLDFTVSGGGNLRVGRFENGRHWQISFVHSDHWRIFIPLHILDGANSVVIDTRSNMYGWVRIPGIHFSEFRQVSNFVNEEENVLTEKEKGIPLV